MYGLIIQEDQWKHHGTSGQKASVNGVINFSVLDGWWAEGYNTKNGWTIGTAAEYENYDIQDNEDSENMYITLEKKIIPMYYNKDEKGISSRWMEMMKNSIITTGGRFSTARMLVDYTKKLYIPLCNLTNKYYNDLATVTEFDEWKKNLNRNWNDIKIIGEESNVDNITVDAGNTIEVKCRVMLPNIEEEDVEVQVYYGQIMENGIMENINIIPMKLVEKNVENKEYEYKAKVELSTGGDFGYTFRVVPKSKMVLDQENLNLVKWVKK